MPFKSKAQQRWMFAAEARGEVPKGTAKEWAEDTDFKKLPDRVKKKKKKKFTESLKKTAALKMPAIKPKTLIGSTDAALRRYNSATLNKMHGGPGSMTPAAPPVTKPADVPYKGILNKYIKKTGSGNLAEDAANESNMNLDMSAFVPGSSLRGDAETGQVKGKNYRTPGVQNESKEFTKSFKKKTQTARGGWHDGGTIREGL